ncbi:MAG: DNRLRE domain-containing protein, partial [Pirellulales bacterium]
MKKFLCLFVMMLLLPAGSAPGAVATVSFQNGANGYNGTFERKIDDRASTDPNQEFDGSTVAAYFVDGYQSGTSVSNDGQALLRFDGLFGSGPGQIPAGAFIVDAQLRISTGVAGNSQSAGPWGIARLSQPFNSSTSYYTSFPCASCGIGSRGPWWQDGYSARPVAGFGGQWQGAVDSANVRSIVQDWANGSPNDGLVIQTGFGTSTTVTSGTTDGWGINATGHPLVDLRPKLTVTYSTSPIEVNTFQHELNGYTSDTMAWLQSGPTIFGTAANPDPSIDDVTTDGATLDQVFLDGPQFSDPLGNTSSPDDMALVKFGSVFGSGANQAPSDVPVAKAWLVMTTGDASQNAPSNGDWSVHRLLRSWDATSKYSGFGTTPGLQVLDGDVAAAADTVEGMISGSEVWFDVTSYLEGVRNGAADFGLAVLSTSTADGWQVHFNGSATASARPRLVVASGVLSTVSPGLAGDYNGDSIVNAADYSVWRDHLGLVGGATAS